MPFANSFISSFAHTRFPLVDDGFAARGTFIDENPVMDPTTRIILPEGGESNQNALTTLASSPTLGSGVAARPAPLASTFPETGPAPIRADAPINVSITAAAAWTTLLNQLKAVVEAEGIPLRTKENSRGGGGKARDETFKTYDFFSANGSIGQNPLLSFYFIALGCINAIPIRWPITFKSTEWLFSNSLPVNVEIVFNNPRVFEAVSGRLDEIEACLGHQVRIHPLKNFPLTKAKMDSSCRPFVTTAGAVWGDITNTIDEALSKLPVEGGKTSRYVQIKGPSGHMVTHVIKDSCNGREVLSLRFISCYESDGKMRSHPIKFESADNSLRNGRNGLGIEFTFEDQSVWEACQGVLQILKNVYGGVLQFKIVKDFAC